MIEIFDCPQGGEEWFRCRMGIPTASNFAAVLASGRNGSVSKTRHAYMLKLAAEVITGTPGEEFSTPAIERGKLMESEARDLYGFSRDVEIIQVGFVKNGAQGCSPDGMIGDDGLLEIKSKRGDLLIETILHGDFPSEHYWQCMGALWVCERAWIDLACFWPGLPFYVRRLHRDAQAIDKLASEVARFNDELAGIVEKIKRYGAAT